MLKQISHEPEPVLERLENQRRSQGPLNPISRPWSMVTKGRPTEHDLFILWDP